MWPENDPKSAVTSLTSIIQDWKWVSNVRNCCYKSRSLVLEEAFFTSSLYTVASQQGSRSHVSAEVCNRLLWTVGSLGGSLRMSASLKVYRHISYCRQIVKEERNHPVEIYFSEFIVLWMLVPSNKANSNTLCAVCEHCDREQDGLPCIWNMEMCYGQCLWQVKVGIWSQMTKPYVGPLILGRVSQNLMLRTAVWLCAWLYGKGHISKP